MDHIDAAYGAVRVLEDVSLTVGGGQTVVLLGTNGNGTSTLMKCIMGMVRPSAGTIPAEIDEDGHGALVMVISGAREDDLPVRGLPGLSLEPPPEVLLQALQVSGIHDKVETHRDRQLVVYCHHGQRSEMVCHWLRGNGFDHAQNMMGGIDAWSCEIDPTVRRY